MPAAHSRVLSDAAATTLAAVCLVALAVAAVVAIGRDRRRSGYTLPVYCGFRVLWLFCKLLHGVRPRGGDPLPRSGPAIVICNHTSVVDPIFLQCCTRRVITFMMAREFFGLRILRPVFRLSEPILVNRTGRDTSATRAALRALAEGRVIGVFPEGRIHLQPGSVGEGKLGAAMMALLADVPVIPAYLHRTKHTNRLVQGIVRPVPTRVCWGPPIDLRRYRTVRHNTEMLHEVTRLLMSSILRLRPQPQEQN